MWSENMRSALFITNDQNLMNRIQIMVHDEAAQFFYADSIDDAVSIMDAQEIAVVFTPYGLDVLSGDEMLEIILDHNPRAQIILLFDDEDLLKVVRAHNTYHLCRLISSSNMKLELLPEKIDAAFARYNKDDDLKDFEKNYRLKEDKYKHALHDMSALLNDRMESYSQARKLFMTLMHHAPGTGLNAEELEEVCNYMTRVLYEYVSLYLLQDADLEHYTQHILDECHNSEQRRYLMIQIDSLLQLDPADRRRCLFVIKVITLFFSVFYERYRGRVETEETENGMILNLVYECIAKPQFAELVSDILPFNESFVREFADRVAFGTKDRIVQYKLIYKKTEHE